MKLKRHREAKFKTKQNKTLTYEETICVKTLAVEMDKNWLLYIGVVVTNDLHKLFGEEFEVTVRWEQVQEKVEETKDDFFQGEQRNGMLTPSTSCQELGVNKD